MQMETSLELQGFYPTELEIANIYQGDKEVLVNTYEYQCDNPDCDVMTFVGNINGFLSYYSRMTEHCADFICTLALETAVKAVHASAGQ